MHPCLRVDEIVRLVASELVEFGGQGSSVTLACCCRSFEDPVLDAQWECQCDMLPLLGSLPGDVWNERGCTVSIPMTHLHLHLNSFV